MGWDEVRWVGRVRWEVPRLGQPMSIHDANTVANSTLVGNRVSGSKPGSLPPNWQPPLVPWFKI